MRADGRRTLTPAGVSIMPRALKVAFIALASGAGLLLLAAVLVSARFDADDVKQLIVGRVQQDYQRTLAIPGEIRLSFFPRLGLQLGAVALSEPGRGETFASVQSARVSLAWLPLLRRQLVVDRIRVDGLSARITRGQDGRISVDDLLGRRATADPAAPEPAAPATPPALQFDVAGLSFTDAAITIDDRLNGRQFELTQVGIETGRLTSHGGPDTPSAVRFQGHVKASQPAIDADLVLQGELRLDPARQHYAFSQLGAALSGRLATLTDAALRVGGDVDIALEPLAMDLSGVALSLQGQHPQGRLDASLDLPQLRLGERDVTAREIVARATLKQGLRVWRAQLTLPPFAGAPQAFKLPAIDGELGIEEGRLRATARLSGAIDGDLQRQALSSPLLKLVLDGRQGETAITGTLASPWVLDLQAQTMDLGRIAAALVLPNPKGGTLALDAEGGAQLRLDRPGLDARLAGRLDDSRFDARLGMSGFAPAVYAFDVDIDRIDVDRYRAAGARASAPGGAAATPQDLAWLRALQASGRLRVGALQVAGMKATDLRLDLRAGGGRLDLNPLAARLNQGRAAGSLALVSDTPPRLVLKQTLSDISLGPLLQDATGRAALEGRGQVVLDLAAQGADVDALRTTLAGHARLALRDGLVRGFNVAQAIRRAKAALGAGPDLHAGTGAPTEATDFSELSASFRVAGGVAHNDDLAAKSPLLRMAGQGDIDLGAGRLDYLLKATVVDTLRGQGGPELQALRDQTIPVRLRGPFTAIDYRIDVAGLVQEIARRKLEDKAQDAKAKLKKELGEQLKGLLGR